MNSILVLENLYKNAVEYNELNRAKDYAERLDKLTNSDYYTKELSRIEAKMIWRLYVDREEMLKGTQDEVFLIMDMLILEDNKHANYLVVENNGYYDNPIYIGFGDKEDYKYFKDSRKPKVKKLDRKK